MRYFKLIGIGLLLSVSIVYATNTRALYQEKYGNENKVALVIGNAAYSRFASLVNSLNDAKDIAQLLKEKNFDVVYVTNGDLQQMENGVKKFASKLKNGGVGFFYYAGHGVQINNSNYLIPINSTISNAIDVKYKSLPVNYVIDMMEGSHNRLNIIVLDACRNDPFNRGGGGLAQINSARGMYIVFATGPGKVASDGDDRNGLFTKHLLQNIKQPNISLDQVFNQTRKGVYTQSNSQQLPWTSSSVIGDFYFHIDDKTLSNDSVTPTPTPTINAVKKPRDITNNLDEVFTQSNIKSFLQNLFRDQAGHDLYAVLEHYERKVQPYFTIANATHNEIYKDIKSHYTQWSQREYQLNSLDIKHRYEYIDQLYADISYKLHWSTSNSKRKKSGSSIISATLKSVGANFKITAIATISTTTHSNKDLSSTIAKDTTRTIEVRGDSNRVSVDSYDASHNYTSPNTSRYPYVCYNRRIKESDRGRITYLKYEGCKRYNKPCSRLAKEHFGKYPNDYKAYKALKRCKISRPRFVD